MKTKDILLIALSVIAGLHLVCQLIEWPIVYYVTKPLIVLTILGYYVFAGVNRSSMVIGALIFCWAGDVLLMFQPKNELFFIAGLIAFLIGHLFYIIAYRQHRTEEVENELLVTQKIRFSLPIILTGTGLIAILYPRLSDLRIPVMVYAIVIMIMVMNALFRFGRTTRLSFLLAFGGAVFFMMSDSILAINKFVTPVPFGGFWIMLTYILAQYMIVQGLIRHQE